MNGSFLCRVIMVVKTVHFLNDAVVVVVVAAAVEINEVIVVDDDGVVVAVGDDINVDYHELNSDLMLTEDRTMLVAYHNSSF